MSSACKNYLWAQWQVAGLDNRHGIQSKPFTTFSILMANIALFNSFSIGIFRCVASFFIHCLFFFSLSRNRIRQILRWVFFCWHTTKMFSFLSLSLCVCFAWANADDSNDVITNDQIAFITRLKWWFSLIEHSKFSKPALIRCPEYTVYRIKIISSKRTFYSFQHTLALEFSMRQQIGSYLNDCMQFTCGLLIQLIRHIWWVDRVFIHSNGCSFFASSERVRLHIWNLGRKPLESREKCCISHFKNSI